FNGHLIGFVAIAEAHCVGRRDGGAFDDAQKFEAKRFFHYGSCSSRLARGEGTSRCGYLISKDGGDCRAARHHRFIFSTDWKLIVISYMAQADAFTSSSGRTLIPFNRYLPMNAPLLSS